MTSNFNQCALSWLASFAIACSVQAEVITVAQDGSGDYMTIQSGINAATDGDEVLVYPGVYTSSGTNVVDISNSIILRSASGPSETVIFGEGIRRCIEVLNADPIIDGFTISNGYAWQTRGSCATLDGQGGGMRISHSLGIVIQNCIIESNVACHGGGIMVGTFGPASPTIINTVFRDNYAQDDGGGLNMSNNGAVINDCVFMYNTTNLVLGHYGGGIYAPGISPTISNSVLCSNSPENIWGGWNDKGGNIVSEDCPDCNGNGIEDWIEIEEGTVPDCNGNLIPDECDVADGAVPDCNTNGIPDSCDVASGSSADADGSGTPDECECLADVSSDGMVAIDDVLIIIALWGSSGGQGDVNYDGTVNIDDLLYVINSWGACP